MAARALQILCLHGFRGSGAGLRAQMRAWPKRLGPGVEFHYLDAPLQPTGQRAWWDAQPVTGAEPTAKRYEGWHASRDLIAEHFAQRGPFDGVLGFSQGATLSALLVGLRAHGEAVPARALAFDFAILVSGFVSKDPEHAAVYAARAAYALPSLHVIGQADAIVPSAASQALAARFDQPTIAEHDGGHVIGVEPETLEVVAEFLGRTARA